MAFNVATLLAKFEPFSKINSERCKANVIATLSEHVKMLFPGILDVECNQKAEIMYSSYRSQVVTHQHLSINISAKRLVAVAKSGTLIATEPKNQYDKLPRDNVEKVFCGTDDLVRPIYAALNTTSKIGGAPSYNPSLWVKLSGAKFADRMTLTSKNTYHVMDPYLGDFNEDAAVSLLQNHVFLWDHVADCFLDRFGHPNGIKTNDYIEAQIWKAIRVDEFEAIFVERCDYDKLVRKLHAIKSIYIAPLVAKMQIM